MNPIIVDLVDFPIQEKYINKNKFLPLYYIKQGICSNVYKEGSVL